MRELKKNYLNFEKSLQYTRHQLKGGNTLSSEVLKSVDFSTGNFFTLLPNDAILEKCYVFTSGGILPQPPMEWYCSEGKMASYSVIPTIQEEMVSYILKKATEDNLLCVFEDVLSTKKNIYLDFFKTHSILRFFKDEVYFVLNRNKLDELIISKCLEKSNAIWHSLCVLSKIELKKEQDDVFGLKEIDTICVNAKLIIIGAYDGEGYVVWEKNHFD